MFVEGQFDGNAEPAFDVVADAGGEIGRYWFVVYDGGPDRTNACYLLAEEHAPGSFYGFWTYDPDRVDELCAYLDETYGSRSRRGHRPLDR